MSNIYSDKNQVVSPFSTALFEVPDIPGSNRQGRHLDELRDSAKKAGHAEGLAEGRTLGRTEGQQEGFAEGLRRSGEQGERERAAMLAAFGEELSALMVSAQASVTTWCETAENEITNRVSAICREVLVRELELDRSSVLEIVRRAMQEVTHSRRARIRINPLDKELILEHKDQLVASVRSLETVDVIFDTTILTGCLIETEGGVVEASADAQLNTLELRLEKGAA